LFELHLDNKLMSKLGSQPPSKTLGMLLLFILPKTGSPSWYITSVSLFD
jgi:hypothetical protein